MKFYAKKQLLPTALTIIALSISSCSNQDHGNTHNAKVSELKVYLASEPLSLDPRIGGDRRSQMMIRELFEGLTRIGTDGKPYLAAAEKVEISQDGLTYRFSLRDGKWSSGDPVTAHDFEYAWKSILDPKFPSGFAYAFTFIKGAQGAKTGAVPLDDVGIRALDDHTLLVELVHPAPYFLELAANPLYAPVSKKAAVANPNWAKNGGTSFVCNGPFILDEWKHQQEVKLKKNPLYARAEAITLDSISAPIIEEPQTALNMFEKGDIDWVGEPFGNLPLEAIPQLKQLNQLEMRSVGGMFWFQVNTNNQLLSNKSIRQALAIALNRKELTEHLLQGGEQSAFSILPSTLTMQETPAFKDHDIQEARRLFQKGLSELGIDSNKLPVIQLSHWQEPREKAIASAVQQQWQNTLGVKITLTSCDWNTYLKKIIASDFDIAGLNWYSWYQDPIYNLESIKFKTSGLNGTGWEHPDYITYLENADKEVDINKRLEWLQKAEALLTNEMPLIPVYGHTYKFAKKPYVKGEYLSPVGQLELKDITIEK